MFSCGKQSHLVYQCLLCALGVTVLRLLHCPANNFIAGQNWTYNGRILCQYSQTNMPEPAPFWPRVVSIQFAHRATYGPVLVTMSGPVEATYWPRYQEYIQAAIWLYLPCQYWPRYDYIMAV